jgi:hypothetical protein
MVPISHKKEHYAKFEEKELSEFLSKIDHYDRDLQTKIALKILLLTFGRTGALHGAR